MKSKSLFYWDYDNYYLNQEAGRFIRENIRQFGSALESQDTDSFRSIPKEIEIVSSPSESAQAGMILPWIESLNQQSDYLQPDSAIVLCNESILPVVMHAIPSDKVENVNITMGFPLAQTPVAGFLQALMDLQLKGISGQKFLHKQVLSVLQHPYTRMIYPNAGFIEKNIIQNHIFFPDSSDLGQIPVFSSTSTTQELAEYLLEQIKSIGEVYRKRDTQDVYDGLYQESVFQVYQLVNRLYGLLESGQWSLERTTFVRLLKKMMNSIQVPFHGEPVKGLQVMGVLETRTIDFKHILMMSVNEGYMPGSNNESTFIPQFLRQHFGLSTYEHQDSIYSYYFYRLIQRAEKLTFVYNTNKSGTGKAEISRFLLQLLFDRNLHINRLSLNSAAVPWNAVPIEVPKTEALLKVLKEKYDYQTNPEAHSLSPSALNMFIDCSLRFYLQKIKGYQAEEELSEEMDASVFGTIFHHASEYLYRKIGRVETQKNFAPFEVRKEDLEYYLESDNLYQIQNFVSDAFERDYFKNRKVDKSQYNGEQLINFNVICEMLIRLIRFDIKQTPFTIIGLEWKAYDFFEPGIQNMKLKVGGIIDRLDEKNGQIRILDYKTGGKPKSFKPLDELFTAKKDRASHVFQTFVYASVLQRKNDFPGRSIVPSLLYIQEMGKDNYSPLITYQEKLVEDFAGLNEEFTDLLESKLRELFDPEIPFRQTTVSDVCKYCDFKEMCNRS